MLLERQLYPFNADIDECAVDNGGCQCDPSLDEDRCVAGCVNSPGSHHCACNEGYTLAANARTCIGKYLTHH